MSISILIGFSFLTSVRATSITADGHYEVTVSVTAGDDLCYSASIDTSIDQYDNLTVFVMNTTEFYEYDNGQPYTYLRKDRLALNSNDDLYSGQYAVQTTETVYVVFATDTQTSVVGTFTAQVCVGTTTPPPGIPGFEITLLLVSIGIISLLQWKKVFNNKSSKPLVFIYDY